MDPYDLQCFSSCWASTQSEVFQLILTFFSAVAARRDSIVVLAGSFGSCHPAVTAGYLVTRSWVSVWRGVVLVVARVLLAALALVVARFFI